MKPPYFKAWIVFYLVVSVGTALVSILANTTIGVIYEAITSMGGDEHPAYLPAVVSVLVGMPISFLTFRWGSAGSSFRGWTPFPLRCRTQAFQPIVLRFHPWVPTRPPRGSSLR
jgi:hypothetical protein